MISPRVLLSAAARFAVWVFQKIDEPRVIRIVVFTAYVAFAILGTAYLVDLPPSFEGVLGTVTSIAFGFFLTLGGLFGTVGILPAMWWLERAGIVLLWTALAELLIVVLALGASTATVSITIAVALLLLNRWLQEADHQRRKRAEP